MHSSSISDPSNTYRMTQQTVVYAFSIMGIGLGQRLSAYRFDNILDQLIRRNYQSTSFNKDLSQEIFSLSRDRNSNEAPVQNLIKYILEAYDILLEKISKLQRNIQTSKNVSEADVERLYQLRYECQCLLMAFGEKAINGRAYGLKPPEIDISTNGLFLNDRGSLPESASEPIVVSPIRQVQEPRKYDNMRMSSSIPSRLSGLDSPTDEKNQYGSFKQYPAHPPPSPYAPYKQVYDYLGLYSQIRYGVFILTTIFSLIGALHFEYPYCSVNSVVAILCIIVLITQFEGRLAVFLLQAMLVANISIQALHIYKELRSYSYRNETGMTLLTILQTLTFCLAAHRLEFEKTHEKSI